MLLGTSVLEVSWFSKVLKCSFPTLRRMNFIPRLTMTLSSTATNAKKLETFIKENTEMTRNHLTPEMKLHLITPRCSLWYSDGANCPVTEPYWAFYWPGGQVLSRYILDNEDVFRDKVILDVGSGCGAASIASAMNGAAYVIANDICPVSAKAIEMNSELNCIRNIKPDTRNLIGTFEPQWDTILLGDMFYDDQFTNNVCDWIQELHKLGKTVLIGDPGRSIFVNHSIKKRLRNVFTVELPEQCKEENNGLTHGSVWLYK